MAEEILVKGILSSQVVKAGEELLKRLDDAGGEVIAAYWIFDPEVGDWRLEFVSPEVESKGPLLFYALVFGLSDEEPKLSPRLDYSSINVLGPKYNRYKELTSAVKGGKNFAGARLNSIMVGGQFVDLYIYRLPARRGK
jgi:hypothetical protein